MSSKNNFFFNISFSLHLMLVHSHQRNKGFLHYFAFDGRIRSQSGIWVCIPINKCGSGSGGLKTYGWWWKHFVYLVLKPRAHAHFRATDWRVNAMGRNYSHSFGYGIMDASAMVRMARIWTTVPEQKISAVKADIGKIIRWSKKDQFCGSGMFVPDPGSEFFPSRIPDLHQRILVF